MFNENHCLPFLKMNRRLGQPAINIYTDKESGKPKGDATLSYEEPICAKAAVEHFDGLSSNTLILKASVECHPPFKPVNPVCSLLQERSFKADGSRCQWLVESQCWVAE